MLTTILTLFVFSASHVALTTAEYNSQAACEAAIAAATKSFVVTEGTRIRGTCTPKG